MKLAGSKLCAEVAQDRSRFVPVLQKCHGSGGSQAWVWIENVTDYNSLSLSVSLCRLSLSLSLSVLPPLCQPLSLNL